VCISNPEPDDMVEKLQCSVNKEQIDGNCSIAIFVEHYPGIIVKVPEYAPYVSAMERMVTS
jgi:hypothetical protein